jgi:DNA-binding NarL/FixJ family response regulator
VLAAPLSDNAEATLRDETPVRVLILDQQRTFTDAIAAWLQVKTDVTVVAAVTSAQSARRLLVGRRVDVIVVDGELPDCAALLLCADMSRESPSARAVILSGSTDPERIVAAFRAGAVGWVGKDEPMRHLFNVMLGVARGEAWIPPVVLHQVIAIFLRHQEQAGRGDGPLSALTCREREVLSLIAHGCERKQVAEQMHLSTNTVRTHMQSLLAKLGAHSALEAVALTRSQLDKSSEVRTAP